MVKRKSHNTQSASDLPNTNIVPNSIYIGDSPNSHDKIDDALSSLIHSGWKMCKSIRNGCRNKILERGRSCKIII